MYKYKLNREQYLPITIDKAWDFFSSPANLSKITPPEMGFVVLTEQTGGAIYAGMKIDYTVKPLFNIRLHWTTEILNVSAPHTFVDKQLKGPYSLWEHTHTFTEVPGGVKMKDEVVYALPLGLLGRLMHKFVVKKKLVDIFNFRKNTLEKLFGKYDKL